MSKVIPKMSDIIYTRSQLKTLKEENDRKIHENTVQQLVKLLTTNIISNATHNTINSYVHSVILSNTEDKQYKIVMDAIDKLK